MSDIVRHWPGYRSVLDKTAAANDARDLLAGHNRREQLGRIDNAIAALVAAPGPARQQVFDSQVRDPLRQLALEYAVARAIYEGLAEALDLESAEVDPPSVPADAFDGPARPAAAPAHPMPGSFNVPLMSGNPPPDSPWRSNVNPSAGPDWERHVTATASAAEKANIGYASAASPSASPWSGQQPAAPSGATPAHPLPGSGWNPGVGGGGQAPAGPVAPNPFAPPWAQTQAPAAPLAPNLQYPGYAPPPPQQAPITAPAAPDPGLWQPQAGMHANPFLAPAASEHIDPATGRMRQPAFAQLPPSIVNNPPSDEAARMIAGRFPEAPQGPPGGPEGPTDGGSGNEAPGQGSDPGDPGGNPEGGGGGRGRRGRR